MKTQKPVSDETFRLDTSNFNAVYKCADKLAKQMAELKNDLDKLKNQLMFSWAGKGRNTFEHKYNLLSRQFDDLKDDLRDIAEELLSKEEAYIQADTKLSKMLDGKSSRY